MCICIYGSCKYFAIEKIVCTIKKLIQFKNKFNFLGFTTESFELNDCEK